MDSFWFDLRYGLRTLARRLGFAAVTVATLALAIGANTAIFSLVRGVLLEPLPFADPDRLVWAWQQDRIRGTQREAFSVADYLDLAERAESFASLAALWPINLNLTGSDQPERLRAGRVSVGFFDTLGLAPVLGRGFLASEDRPGAEPVTVLSEGLWQRRFGADAEIVGRTVRLDGVDRVVVGVVPSAAGIPPGPEEVWVPAAFSEEEKALRGRHGLLVLGRLADGVSQASAQAEIDTVMGQLEAEYPDDNLGRGAQLVTVRETLVGDVRPALLLLLGAVGIVLLVACVNLANVTMARATSRHRELAVRSALGASRGRVVRQLLSESLLLAVAGGALGVLLASWTLDLLVALGGGSLPRLETVRIDGLVLAFTAALSLSAAFLFGLLPAVRASRPDLTDALKEAAPGSGAGAGRHRVRRGLVVAEVAMAVVLVIVAGLLLRSLWQVMRVDPGLDPEGVLVVDLELPQTAYPFPEGWPVFDWPQGLDFFRRLEERVAALPGVEGATTALNGPLSSGWTTRVTIEGQPEPPPGEQDEARFRPVGPGYFRLLRVPLLAGREFALADRGDAAKVAVVNEAFARRYFPGASPLGERINIFGEPREVVGLAGDVRYRGLEAEVQPTMYVPFHQNPLSGLSLVVRAGGDPLSLVPAVRAEIEALDPDLPLYRVATLDGTLAESLAQRRFTLWLLGSFAGVALLLAAIGIYGTVSLGVAERRHEIGVRLALGGARADIRRMVLRQALQLTLLGVGLGLVGALLASRLFSALLYEVAAYDGWTYAAVGLVLAVVALAAAWVPAARATSVDPVVALHGR